MRLKGVNPFEQHVEKIVVAVVGAVVLAIITWQVIGPKPTVKVGPNDVPYDQAYAAIETKARDVERRAKAADVQPPADKLKPNPLLSFDERFQKSIARAPMLAWDGGVRGGAGSIIDQHIDPDLTIAKLAVPPTRTPIARAYMSTVSPGEVAAFPKLKDVLPPQMPYDKAGVSVETTFDGKALADALAADPDGATGPMKPIPTHWWRGNMQLLAVELQRQEQQPDGSWGPESTIEALPGRPDPAGEIRKGTPDDKKLKELIKLATDNAEGVRRPPYLATIMGEEWVPPSEVKIEAGAAVGSKPEVDRLRQQIEDKDRRIKNAEDQLQKLGQGGGPGGAGGRGGGGGGGGAADPNAARRKQLTDLIEKLKKERDDFIEQLRKLGFDRDGKPIPQADPAPGAPPGSAAKSAEAPLLTNPDIRIWAHDITAERGKTYRYRLSVIVTNPIYGHANGLKPEIAELAKAPTIRSADGPWSDALHVPDDTYFFIINAQDGARGGPLAGARATAELYAFAWGYWRKGSVTLEPGDPVMGSVKVPDYQKLLAAKPDPDQPGGAPPPPSAPPPPRPGFGGGHREAPPAPGGANAPPDLKAPPKEKLTYNEIPVSRDAYLLDVAAVPAVMAQARAGGLGGPAQFQAFLRDSGGKIVIRIPEQDQSDPEYRQISASALKGDEMLRPREEAPKSGMPPKPDGGGQQGPRGKGGGGGGGGAGGGGG